ncbi:MAG TPA: UV damage endonuclease UvsE, partial [Coleofasciculaceae cyanobacterium]
MSLSSVTPQLGLVCITASKAVRYRTVTRKRLLQFSESEQEEMLRNLYQENLQRLSQAIDFCLANDIKLYRL